jgi:hypothetical protein
MVKSKIKNKVKSILLLMAGLYAAASFAMVEKVDDIVSQISAHNELSPEESAQLHAILSVHDDQIKSKMLVLNEHGKWVLPIYYRGINITPDVVKDMLPFIKKENDPFLIECLICAIGHRQEDVVYLLIEQARVSVNVRAKCGGTPLRRAVEHEPHELELVRYFLEKGADIDGLSLENRRGATNEHTPLAAVARCWFTDGLKMERMRILLEYGARIVDVNAKHEDVLQIAERRVKKGLRFAEKDLLDLQNLIAEKKRDGAILARLLSEGLDGFLPAVLHPEVGGFVTPFYQRREN